MNSSPIHATIGQLASGWNGLLSVAPPWNTTESILAAMLDLSQAISLVYSSVMGFVVTAEDVHVTLTATNPSAVS